MKSSARPHDHHNHPMNIDTAILAAANLGTIAHAEGRPAIPAHDKPLMEVIANLKDKEIGASLPVLKAWSDSWHAANLN